MLAGVSAFALSLGRARTRRRAPLRAAAPFLTEAEAASARGDRAATTRGLAAALRAALEVRVPGAGALATEELARRDEVSIRAIADALGDLDRARFAPAVSAARSPDLEAVRALIAAL
jgi:hypothetical protein